MAAADTLQPASHFNKLHEDADEVLREARTRPEFQSAEDEAKEQRIAQLVLPNRVLGGSLVLG